jgi:transglutaminase-like putative cysteine protease
MLYAIRHRTLYRYTSPVASARVLTHVEPISRPDQDVLSCHLAVLPQPIEMAEFSDFFGNRTRTMRLLDLPQRLVIEATSQVRVTPRRDLEGLPSPAWHLVRDQACGARDLGPTSPVHMIFPSRRVPVLAGATALAEPCIRTGQPILALAKDLMHRIHDGFAYDPEATEVSTPLAEVIRLKRGVCQDFAHLMIAALRGHGIPAAYVSGYLRTQPPPGRERLVGADATHAWVQVWCGTNLGWVGFDPTNAVLAGVDHVILAVGRDYADVAPVAGVVTLSEDHHVDVEVDVLPLEDEQPAAVVAAG